MHGVHSFLEGVLLAFALAIHGDDEDLGTVHVTQDDGEHDQRIIVAHVVDRARGA